MPPIANSVPAPVLGAFYRCGTVRQDRHEYFRRCGLPFPRFVDTGGILFTVGAERDLAATVPVITLADFELIARDAAPRDPGDKYSPVAPAMLVLLEASPAEAEAFITEGAKPRDRLEDVERQLAESKARNAALEERLMKLELAAGKGPTTETTAAKAPAKPPAAPAKAPSAPANPPATPSNSPAMFPSGGDDGRSPK